MKGSVIRLFQLCAYAWTGLYMLSLLVLGKAAWSNAPVDLFLTHDGVLGGVQRLIGSLPGEVCIALCILSLVFCGFLMRRHRWWLGVLVWLFYRVIDQRLWLASNGGVQLMGTMLLWAALMGGDVNVRPRAFAYWAARLQLLLVYAAAAAHKFTGTTWLDGTAMSRVVHDPLFHLGWLASFPLLCTLITYAVLAWMTLFPFAVWWPLPRRAVLVFGVLFHLCTAIFLGIPQMGFAFIACYTLWWEREKWSATAITSLPSTDQGR
jgi:hypothetical protein